MNLHFFYPFPTTQNNNNNNNRITSSRKSSHSPCTLPTKRVTVDSSCSSHHFSHWGDANGSRPTIWISTATRMRTSRINQWVRCSRSNSSEPVLSVSNVVEKDHITGPAENLTSVTSSDELSDLTDNNEDVRDWEDDRNKYTIQFDTFSNNHVLVNQARQAYGIHILQRSVRLDTLARQHVDDMAAKGRLFHSCKDLEALKCHIGHGVNFVGENVQRGRSVKQMHWNTMKKMQRGRDNILSTSFHEFGMSTAKDKHGLLYMVQLFCDKSGQSQVAGWTWCNVDALK